MGLVPDPNKFDLIWLPVGVKYSTRDLICDDINYCVLEWRRKNLYHWPVSMRFFEDLVVAYFLCHLYIGLPFLNAVLCARYNKQKQSKTAMCILVTVDVWHFQLPGLQVLYAILNVYFGGVFTRFFQFAKPHWCMVTISHLFSLYFFVKTREVFVEQMFAGKSSFSECAEMQQDFSSRISYRRTVKCANLSSRLRFSR